MHGSTKPKIIKTDETKVKLYNDILLGKISAVDLIKSGAFKKSTAYNYVKLVRARVPLFEVARKPGKPSRLDPDTCDWIKAQIEEREKMDMAPIAGGCDVDNSIGQLISEGIKKQNRRLKKCDKVTVSAVEAKRLAPYFDTKEVNGTKITNAHWLALHDARNAISMMVASMAIRSIIGNDRRLLLNLDATAFQHLGIDKKKKIQKVYTTNGHYKMLKEDGSEVNTILSTQKSDTAAFVKFLVLVNGAGEAAPFVALIDDNNMVKGETEVHEIKKFAQNNCDTGLMAINNGRNGTANFYEAYYKQILIPFVQKLRENYGMKAKEKAILWLDGEDIQMQPLLRDELRSLLRQQNILILKGPASTTPKTQLLDTSVVFKGSHAGANDKNAGKHAAASIFLRGQIESALKIHATSKATIKAGADKQFKAKITKWTDIILRAEWALRRMITETNIGRGLNATGVMNFQGNWEPEVIINNFGITLETHEHTQFLVDCDKLVKTFKNKGYLRDQEIEATQYMQQRFIRGMEEPIIHPKDKGVLHSMRCVLILTQGAHHLVDAREEAKEQAAAEKEAKKTAASDARKEKEKASREQAIQRGIQRELKKQSKKETQTEPKKNTKGVKAVKASRPKAKRQFKADSTNDAIAEGCQTLGYKPKSRRIYQPVQE
jgi:hypothetical protein